MAVIKRQWRAWLAVVAILAGVFLLWDRKTFAADQTIVAPTTFASLDNGGNDADPTVGVVEINGNLTIAAGGSITCNDDLPLPTTASACPINLVVTGNLLIEAGGAIYAENRRNGGAGGDITITVGGNLTMEGPGGGNAGAIVDKIYVAGYYINGGMSTATTDAYAYDPKANAWTKISSLPAGTQRAARCVAVNAGLMYVIGGADGGKSVDHSLSAYGILAKRANVNLGVPVTVNTSMGNFAPATDTYINPAAFSSPGTYQLGNSARTLDWLRGWPVRSESASINKTIHLYERLAMRIGGDFQNPFNLVRWGNPVTTLTASNFGKVTSSNPGRRVQLTMNIEF
jgi:hypothetical protein